tara:strand:- start:103 stop:378 length:276 start_codon:yes stop_codon:yes gene_type:complete
MADKPVPGSYIDTQGMGAPADPNYKSTGKQEYKPATVRPRRLFTETYAKELKILINEVLDERDGKRGISYFNTEHFKHLVTEEEPPYEKWE